MAKKAPPATAGKTESAGAQPAAAPIRPPKKTEINLRVEFTRDEIVELALKQGEAFNELNRAEEDKKAVTAQLKAKCEGISARISWIAHHREIYSHQFCPGTTPTSCGISGLFTAADSHQPKLARGIQF